MIDHNVGYMRLRLNSLIDFRRYCRCATRYLLTWTKWFFEDVSLGIIGHEPCKDLR